MKIFTPGACELSLRICISCVFCSNTSNNLRRLEPRSTINLPRAANCFRPITRRLSRCTAIPSPPAASMACISLRHIQMQLLEFVLNLRAHFFERRADVMLIQIIRRLRQLAWRVVMVGADHAILHIAIAGHHNQQHALIGEIQKFQMLERLAATLRCHHYASESG